MFGNNWLGASNSFPITTPEQHPRINKENECVPNVDGRGEKLSLIPVVDLLDGQVVHAMSGQRSTYQPFQSSQFSFETPCELVRELANQFNPPWVYLADLNAIQSRGNNQGWIRRMSGVGTRFLIDSGFRCWQDYVELRRQIPAELEWKPVFGTETLESPAELAQACAGEMSHGTASFFISIDLKNKQVIQAPGARVDELKMGSGEYINYLLDLGFQHLIILDLDSVGTGKSSFANWTSTRYPEDPSLELFVGGGVRSWQEIDQLKSQGYAGALVASAIHSGEIRPRKHI